MAPAQSSGRRLGMQPLQMGPRVVLPPAHMRPEPKAVPPPARMRPVPPTVPPPARMRAVPRVVPPRVQNAGMPREPAMPPKAKWAQQAQQAHLNIAMAAAREQARCAADWALAQKELDEHQQALDDAASDEEAEFLLAQHQAEEEAEAEEVAAAYGETGYEDGDGETGYEDEAAYDELAGDGEGETGYEDDAALDQWPPELAGDGEGETGYEDGAGTTSAWDAEQEAWQTAAPQHVKPMRAKDKRGSVTRGGRHVQAKRKADMLGEGGLKMFVEYQAAEQLALETGAASRTFTEWQRDNRAGRNVGSSTSHERWGKATHYQWGGSSSSSAGGQWHGAKRRR